MLKEGEDVDGYDAFVQKIKELEKDKGSHPLYILFTGSSDAQGKSWCPDCVQFEAMWDKMKTTFQPAGGGSLVRVKVGPRDSWKDQKCPFRTDKTIGISSIPTLVKWGTPKRLSNGSIQSKDNVQMLMEED